MALRLAVAATSLGSAAALLDGPWNRRPQSRAESQRLSLEQDTETLLTSKLPFYHTTEQIRSEAQRLTSSCQGADASMRTVSKDGVSIDVVSVRGKQASPINKVFMLFGEHSRELISPESGLFMLKVLCGEEPLGEHGDAGPQALLQSEFQIVLNGNPRSRAKVESGDYCLRENPAGVDLNRNWGTRWQSESMEVDTHPGPKPFSEPETQLLKDLISEYKPSSFLSIHSGNLGLYMPWAYDREHSAERNRVSMMEVLKTVDAAHCQCPFGAAGQEVGYSSPGTSIDWVYDKLSAPFSFAYEIYLDPAYTSGMKERWQQKLGSGGSALLQMGATLEHPHFHEVFHGQPSDFVQVNQTRASKSKMSTDECLQRFNPITEEVYDSTIKNWARAYFDTAQKVAQDLAKAKIPVL